MTLEARDINILFDQKLDLNVKDQDILIEVSICKIKGKVEMLICTKRKTTLGLLSQAKIDYNESRILGKGKPVNKAMIDDIIKQAQSEKFIGGLKSFLTAHYEARL